MVNYIEEAMESILQSDELFYEEILEQMIVERDFMLACLENNIILEADNSSNENKDSWIKRIIDTIKSIFNKFIENVKKLFNNDEKWIRENGPKIKNLNFNNLTINNLTPYWNLKSTNITSTLKTLQDEINVKIGDSKIKNLQSREDLENVSPFKPYVRKNGTFNDGIKSFFTHGSTNEAQLVKLEDNALKNMCVQEMLPFVMQFNATLIPSLQNSQKNLENMLKRVERELNASKTLNESFCVIENTQYGLTDLIYCENANILFEADNNQQQQNTQNQNNNNTNNNDGKLSMEDKNKSKNDNNNQSSNNNDNKKTTPNTEYYNYLKNVIQMNQFAIAAAITASENRYRDYMKILRFVYQSRSGN